MTDNNLTDHLGDDVEHPLYLTGRPTSPAMERILQRPISVLDHGSVTLIDYMGDDAAIAEAARTSYGRGTRQVSGNRGLIRYLMRHAHSTPFEMCEIKLHLRMPIFVARQWMRHRMASINEYSARYSVLEREFYLPSPEVLAQQSTTNNQGRGDVLAPEQAQRVLEILTQDSARAYDDYEEMIDPNGTNLARELARINLPVSVYTQFYWKIDLHNLLHFLRLRADSHAQHEIVVYAQVLQQIVEDWVPEAFEAFVEYRRDSQNFSKTMVDILRRAIRDGVALEEAAEILPARERREFLAVFA